MLTPPRLRLAALALLLLGAAAVSAPAAQAAPVWNCEASPLHARLLGVDLTLGLLTSNADAPRCQTDSRGIGALAGGPPAGLSAGTLDSSTSLTGAAGAIAGQQPNASAGVADVRVGVTGLADLLRVDAATSSATGACSAGAPSLTATSTVGDVDLGGVRVAGLDGPVTVTGNVVNGLPVGTVAHLVPNEETLADGVLTRSALHVTVDTLGVSVLDVTLARSQVAYSGAVCDATAQQQRAQPRRRRHRHAAGRPDHRGLHGHRAHDGIDGRADAGGRHLRGGGRPLHRHAAARRRPGRDLRRDRRRHRQRRADRHRDRDGHRRHARRRLPGGRRPHGDRERRAARRHDAGLVRVRHRQQRQHHHLGRELRRGRRRLPRHAARRDPR
jgi:hypothetical protein